jgi:hypothetical protein
MIAEKRQLRRWLAFDGTIRERDGSLGETHAGIHADCTLTGPIDVCETRIECRKTALLLSAISLRIRYTGLERFAGRARSQGVANVGASQVLAAAGSSISLTAWNPLPFAGGIDVPLRGEGKGTCSPVCAWRN